MQRKLRWICALLFLGWTGAASAANKPEKPPTKDKIAAGHPFLAKVKSVEGSTKNFTVEVTYVEIDRDKVQAHAQYDAKRRLEISLIASIQEKQRQLVAHAIEMRKRQADIYKKATKDLKLEAGEKTKFRTLVLPVDYDEKGKIKKYSKKELRDLKGPNKRLPGYTAEFENLKKDQMVRIYPAKQKYRPRKKDKDEDLSEHRFKVVMVVIEHEPPGK
jgi:hypothetical protein